jgi:predicted metal-dependent peptidase
MKKNIHPKILHCLEMMLLNGEIDMPYYAEFNATVNFFERPNDPNLKTAGVNVTEKGMNHYYNPSFIDGLTQKQVNFLVLHETFHLLFNHPRRTRMGGYDHELSNISQDMIINQILVKDIKASFLDIPKDKYGKNTALFIPKDYEGEWVFEILYDWLKLKKEETLKRRRKKEEEKIFSELYILSERPYKSELTQTYQGQFNTFLNILIDKSKDDCENYMGNFVRRCMLSMKNMKPVTLYGHTDSDIPDNETDVDYNLNLSIRRAEIFKNAVIENIDKYCDTYAYCITILEYESKNVSREDKIRFIIKYEEILNDVLKKQRVKELNEPKLNNKDHNEVELLFETYRFTELNKLDDKTLIAMCTKNGLTIPSIQQEKLQWIQTAREMIVVEGKGDTEKIILNDDIEAESIIRNNIAHLPQYKPFKYITDPEVKKEINRRVTYKFGDDNCNGGSPKTGLGGGESTESSNQNNRDGYGQNSQNEQESYDLDGIFNQSENNSGEFLDQHIPDTIPEELREQMIRDIQERLRSRGLISGDVETILNKLKKKRKDYLKQIKSGISFIKGSVKDRTIKKPSRRGYAGIKGTKKIGSIINVLLDTSGSMNGYETKALNYIFRSDIEINLIQCDTIVHDAEKIKSMKELQSVKVRGGGGTVLQPGINLIKEKYSQYNTLILGDGFCDALDFRGYKGKVLIISNAEECPIAHNNGKVKQIIIENFKD